MEAVSRMAYTKEQKKLYEKMIRFVESLECYAYKCPIWKYTSDSSGISVSFLMSEPNQKKKTKTVKINYRSASEYLLSSIHCLEAIQFGERGVLFVCAQTYDPWQGHPEAEEDIESLDGRFPQMFCRWDVQ